MGGRFVSDEPGPGWKMESLFVLVLPGIFQIHRNTPATEEKVSNFSESEREN